MGRPDEQNGPGDNDLYDEVVRPAVEAVAALGVDAEPALRFAPLSPIGTRAAEGSDAAD